MRTSNPNDPETMETMGMLKGKTAVVTGSTSGIGRAIAESLADLGASVVINGFGDADDIEALRCDLERRSGAVARYDSADMSQADAVRGLITGAIDHFGSVDVLVNNAGIQHVAPIEAFPPATWDAILAINLSSAFHTAACALPVMKQKGWGRIINIASAHALVASPFKSAYVAAKHGVAGLTKTIALEAAEHGVTANAVCPGYVWTPLVEKQVPETARARGLTEAEVIRDVLLAAQPTKAFVTVGQVAGLVGFLASEAAASITGAILTIDGGWTAE